MRVWTRVLAAIISFECARAAQAASGVLAVGGSDATTIYALAEFYDTGANTWTTMAAMPTARNGLCLVDVTLGGIAGALAVGGYAPSITAVTGAAEFYDPNTNSWTTMAPMNVPRYGVAGAIATVGGVTGVLVVGGSSGSWLNTVEFYDPGANTWTVMAPMPTTRHGLCAAPVTYGGVAGVLAVGGWNGALQAAAEFYNPGSNSWSSLAPLPGGGNDWPSGAAITVGGVAGMLVAGGWTGGNNATAYFYDPGANSWSARAPLSLARHAAACSIATIGGAAGSRLRRRR